MSADGVQRHANEPRRGFFRHLGPRLAFSFSLVFVLVLACIQIGQMFGVPFTSFTGMRGEHRTEALMSLDLIADLKKERLQRWLEERRDDLAVSAANPMIREHAVSLRGAMRGSMRAGEQGDALWERMRGEEYYDEIVDFLDTVRNAYGVYEAIYLADAETGTIFLSTKPTHLGVSVASQVDFKALGTWDSYLRDIADDPQSSEPHLHFSHAVRAPDGEMVAVFVMEVHTDDIIRPMLHTGEGLGNMGEALLVNQDRVILTSLKHALPDGTKPQPLEYEITAKPAVLAASGHEGFIEALDYRGEPVLAAYRHIRVTPDWGWGLVIKRDRAEVLAPLWKEIRYSTALGLVGMGVFIGLAIVLARGLTGPIRRLSRTAERVAGGDLSARTGVAGSDEVGFLADTFDGMLDRVEFWHAELEEEVEARTAELAEANEGLLAEVEQRKQAEASLAEHAKDLERSNMELEQFAYVASHDLQEPLRMVSSFTQLLEKRYGDQLDSDAREFIGFAVDGASRMQSLIADLLTYSRLGTHGAPFAPINCETVLERVTANLKLTIEETDTHLSHDALPTVVGDREQLHRLFQNLIGNAIKFRGGAAPRIHVSAEKKGDDWIFSICDNGIGIDRDYADRIFEVFQRLHGRDLYKGTGIGLAICKKIVERHKGRIWMESKPEEGATFYFTLPWTGDDTLPWKGDVEP